MFLNILLFLLLFECKGEIPQTKCDPPTPFRRKDRTCGSFNDICVKTNDEDCNYFQEACKQCPASNYTVLMLLDIKSRISRSNIILDWIKNQINISIPRINVTLDIIEKKSTNQVDMVIACLFFIILNTLGICIFFIEIRTCRQSSSRNQPQIYSNYEDATQLINYHQQEDGLINTQNPQTDCFGMFNFIDIKDAFKEIKERMNEKNERFEAITNEIKHFQAILNEKYIYLESVVSYKLRFQIANQFDETELFVSKFDNVIKLKKLICDRNMNMYDYKRMIMKYKGVTLDNNQFLRFCIDSTNIPIFCEFDNVDVNAMIVIKLKGYNIYPEMLQTWKHQQIKDLKFIISKLNETNYDDVLIFYKSTKLDDDDKTIDDYKIENNDWINVLNKSEEVQKISMKSIFTAKETISIEFSKSETVSDIINKSIKQIEDKMATNHFVVFLNKKLLQNNKFIYEYNIDSKSLVEFCYYKKYNDFQGPEKIITFGHIHLFKAKYKNKSVFVKAYKKEYMKVACDEDFSRVLGNDLQMFQITKSHPRFMQLLGIYMDDDWVYIGLENSTKISMRSYLSITSDKSAPIMSKWAYQILGGLKHLHKHNIILKDMNPTDIWIDGNHDIKLPSFNMTEYLNHLHDNLNEHKDGVLRYVAPEILESKPYEASSDVWSLGVVMIEIATCAPLFPRLSDLEIVKHINSLRIEYDKTNISLDLINFIDSCLEKDSTKRAKVDELLKYEFIEEYL